MILRGRTFFCGGRRSCRCVCRRFAFRRAKKRRLALRRKRAAINLPLRGLNNLCQRGVKYESRRADKRQSCGTEGVCARVRALARLVFITQINTHVCICVFKKKKKLAPPCDKTEYWRRRRRRGKRLLFVRVSLLIDASHKTSTIRDHSSSFLPLLLNPDPQLVFYSPSALRRLLPSFLPSSIPLPPSPRFLCVGATLVSTLPRVVFVNELRELPNTEDLLDGGVSGRLDSRCPRRSGECPGNDCERRSGLFYGRLSSLTQHTEEFKKTRMCSVTGN